MEADRKLALVLTLVFCAACSDRRRGDDDDDIADGDADIDVDGDADTDTDADTDGDTDADSDADGDIGSPWTEETCEPTDLYPLEADYSPMSWEDSVLPVLDARYTIGAYVLRDSPQQGGCQWANFVSDTSQFAGMLEGLGTIVHEMGHCWGFQFLGAEYAFLVTPEHEYHVQWLQNFPRSEIVSVHEFANDDMYRDVYLVGQSGDQGFDTVLDELNQYIHSLAVAYCYVDYQPYSTSARDGVLTFLYYVEKYLEVGRTSYPNDYDTLVGDAGTMEVLDALWGRSQFYLDLTDGDTRLGINDGMIADFVYDPANLEEVRRALP